MEKKKIKVLIVDDEPTNQFILKEILCDYDLLFASGGTEAIDLVKKEYPDLIILDVKMPEMSSHDVCKILKSNPATVHIPKIFISAMSETNYETLGFASEYRDNETCHHVIRVSHYAKMLAKPIGYSDELVEENFYAASMLDVGKIGIPDYILTQPGKLESEEWEIIKKHPFLELNFG